MKGNAVVTDEINFAIAEGKVIRSVSKGSTEMTVSVGKPLTPAKPPSKKKGSAVVPVAASTPAQILKMTVRTDIETNIVEPGKK